MGGEWRLCTLEDLAVAEYGLVDGPFGSNLPAACYQDTGIPVVRGSNLSVGSGKFKQHEFVFVSQRKFQELSRSGCVADDIVFTKKGTLGQTGMIPADGPYLEYLLSSNQMRLRVNKAKAIPSFVYYCVSSPESVRKIIRDSESTGVPKINLEYLRSFPIKLPSLEAQKNITHILGTLDDKIELNRQTNQTLESLAQALFKSWFVDFDPVIDNALAAGNDIPEPLKARAAARQALGDERKPLPEEIRHEFPDAFEFVDEMGWVPRGWKLSSVDSEFTLKGGATPSTKNSEFWEDGDIPWTTPKDLSDSETKVLLGTARKITAAGLAKISSGLLPECTVLMSSRAPVGYLALPTIPVAINQGYIALICDKVLSPVYAVQWLETVMDDVKQRASGTTFAEISKKSFREIPLIVPGEACVEAFSSITEDLYKTMECNLHTSERLSKTRDTLLPKLLSGELTIPDAEKLAANAL